jgi:two-component sensor histidine kinase
MKAISNAFKHGKTTRATVEFQISEPGFVEIVIENNGVGLPPKNKPGLGSELIDEIAHPWTRQNKSVGGVILTARLPVSRKRHKG